MSVLRASRQRHPQRAALQDGLVLRRALAAFGVLVILFLSMGFAVSPASAQTTTTSPGGGTSSGPGANVGVEGDIIANGPNSPEVGGPTNPTTPPPGSNPEAEAEKTEEQKNREAFEQNAGTESVGQTGDGSGGITSEIIRRATESIASFVGSIAASAVRSVIFGFIYNAADANVYSDCSTTSSDCWLNAQVDMMRTIALPVMLPLLVLAVIQGVIKGSLFKILKVLALAVPIAIVGSTLAQPAIQLLLYIADDMSAVFEQSASNDIGRGAENITRYMLQPSFFGPQAGGSGIILHLLLGLGIILSTLGVMVVLLLRTASIYIATMFMPIAFVMLVWPATSRYFFKLVQFLAAIIFSKVVMMAGLALAFSVLATIGVADGSVGSTAVDGGAVADVAAASTAATTEASRQEVYSQVILFIAMMLLVTFSPGALMKFLDNFSLGEGSSAVTSHLSAPDFTNAIIFLGRIQSIYDSSKIIGSSIRTRSENAQWAKAVSKEEYLASAIGIDKRDGSDYFTGYELVESDVAHIDDPLERERLMTMSRSEDFNEVLLANVASEAARNGWEVVDIHKDLISEGAVVDGSASIHGVELLRSEGSQAGERTMAYFADATTREGVPITTIDPRHLKVVAEAAADKGIKNTTVLTGIMPNTTEETDKRFIEIAKQASALSGSSVIVTATNASQGDLSSQLRNRAHTPREYQQTAAANARRHADFAPRNNFPGGFVPTGGGAPGGSGPGGGAPGGAPGGSTPGGGAPGGSSPGGSTPGGSTPGGSTPGGSTPGGTPGGSSPGGASRFTPPPTSTPSTGSPPYAGFTPPPSGGQSSGGSSSGAAPFVPFVPRPNGGGRSSNGGSSPRPSRSQPPPSSNGSSPRPGRSQPVRSQPNPTPNPRKSFFSRPNAGSNPAPPPRSAPPPKVSRFGRKPKSGVPKAPKPNRRIRRWT